VRLFFPRRNPRLHHLELENSPLVSSSGTPWGRKRKTPPEHRSGGVRETELERASAHSASARKHALATAQVMRPGGVQRPIDDWVRHRLLSALSQITGDRRLRRSACMIALRGEVKAASRKFVATQFVMCYAAHADLQPAAHDMRRPEVRKGEPDAKSKLHAPRCSPLQHFRTSWTLSDGSRPLLALGGRALTGPAQRRTGLRLRLRTNPSKTPNVTERMQNARSPHGFRRICSAISGRMMDDMDLSPPPRD
jgi:hypothetical protein